MVLLADTKTIITHTAVTTNTTMSSTTTTTTTTSLSYSTIYTIKTTKYASFTICAHINTSTTTRLLPQQYHVHATTVPLLGLLLSILVLLLLFLIICIDTVTANIDTTSTTLPLLHKH